jgi:hypothetical protein
LVYVWASGDTLHWAQCVVVSLCGASGDTLHWVLLWAYVGVNWVLLVYVAPRATHFTGYCCWFMRGIVVGYVAPRAYTPYWLLLLVYEIERPRTTHFTRYFCVMRGFGQHILLGIIRSDMGRLHQWVENNIFQK